VDVVLLLARILFAVVFLASGMGHLTQTEAMAGYAGSKGVPMPKQATLVSGVVLIVGALFVVLGLWGDLGALMLFAFLVPTALVMHQFWKETDPMMKMTEMVQFNKDISLAGAALAFVWIFSAYPDLTLTDPLFGFDRV
jgi:putative oxidoreductase